MPDKVVTTLPRLVAVTVTLTGNVIFVAPVPVVFVVKSTSWALTR